MILAVPIRVSLARFSLRVKEAWLQDVPIYSCRAHGLRHIHAHLQEVSAHSTRKPSGLLYWRRSPDSLLVRRQGSRPGLVATKARVYNSPKHMKCCAMLFCVSISNQLRIAIDFRQTPGANRDCALHPKIVTSQVNWIWRSHV